MIKNRYGTLFYKSSKIRKTVNVNYLLDGESISSSSFVLYSLPYIVCAALLCLLSISSLFHHHPAFEWDILTYFTRINTFNINHIGLDRHKEIAKCYVEVAILVYNLHPFRIAKRLDLWLRELLWSFDGLIEMQY